MKTILVNNVQLQPKMQIEDNNKSKEITPWTQLFKEKICAGSVLSFHIINVSINHRAVFLLN